MGIAHRIAELYRVKVNALLDRAEDPGEMLDYSYRQQQEFLRRMHSAAADVRARRNRAKAQEDKLRRAADRLRAQVLQALAAGDEGRVPAECPDSAPRPGPMTRDRPAFGPGSSRPRAAEWNR